MDGTTGNVTAPGPAAGGGGGGWPLDAGSMFVLAFTLIVFVFPVFLIFPPVPPSKSDALAQTHTKLGLEPHKSNLRDQHATASSHHASRSGGGGQGTTAARIKSLFVYPVKSCKGIEVARSKVVPSGLEFDRMFTFAQLKSPFPVGVTAAGEADEKSGQHVWEFITQRQFPLLATVDVDLWQPDLIKQKGKPVRTNDAFIILRFPWQAAGFMGLFSWIGAKVGKGWGARPEKEIMLPVEVPSKKETQDKGYEYESVKIWKDTITALNMGSEVPEELAHYLGVSNKLTIFRIDHLREVFRSAPTKDEAGYQPVTGFADAVSCWSKLSCASHEVAAHELTVFKQYPLHLLGLSSVRDLDSKLAKDADLQNLDAQRFRANILGKYIHATWFMHAPEAKAVQRTCGGEANNNASCSIRHSSILRG